MNKSEWKKVYNNTIRERKSNNKENDNSVELSSTKKFKKYRVLRIENPNDN